MIVRPAHVLTLFSWARSTVMWAVAFQANFTARVSASSPPFRGMINWIGSMPDGSGSRRGCTPLTPVMTRPLNRALLAVTNDWPGLLRLSKLSDCGVPAASSM